MVGASVPSDQAPVRSDESPVSRSGEEHRAHRYLVRAIESMDGATKAIGDDRVITPAVCKMKQKSEEQ